MIFFKARETSFGEMYYGTSDLKSLIPGILPYKFNNLENPWCVLSAKWFNEGLSKESAFKANYGFDKERCIRHIMCLFNTWALTKQEKISYGALLMSMWFEKAEI